MSFPRICIIRPISAQLRALNISPTTSTTTHRNFSSTSISLSGGAPEYDPPTGWLWGIKPGEKVEKPDWEYLWIYGFFGSLGMATVAYAFKPDTSIQTWALEEARRRLEAEGILEEPDDE